MGITLEFPKELRLNLHPDSARLLLDIYLKISISYCRDLLILFIAVLLIKSRKYKEPEYSATDNENMVPIQMKFYSSKMKKKLCTVHIMDGSKIIFLTLITALNLYMFMFK